ncbi:hypothetical protein BCR34DRAFT_607939 [Clohesyomyces aquaticus]|uniref:DNase1 protein n=1 Tax=Clohesyomyces aquaticus TaxID=1231657 RepID=A0A1Y1YBR9_9PLEO|nr:hypothetical protein BCR34DRAFT_607939 [Clohesyomyces aquaticus]
MLHPVAGLIALSAFAFAADVSIKEGIVTAGQAVEVTVSNANEVNEDLYPGAVATNLKIGLFNSNYQYWMCSLTDFIPAKNGTVIVIIPPEMGPSGAYYAISAYGLSNPPPNSVWSGFVVRHVPTQYFFLTNGTGIWTPEDISPLLQGQGLIGLWDADIPCSSYPCAQKCAGKQFPDEHAGDAWTLSSTYLICLKKCDGVKIDYDRIKETEDNKPLATHCGSISTQ